eukprot:COSAG06_NODE_28899_length_565_cov_17215.600858_1_plen_151_part_00
MDGSDVGLERCELAPTSLIIICQDTLTCSNAICFTQRHCPFETARDHLPRQAWDKHKVEENTLCEKHCGSCFVLQAAATAHPAPAAMRSSVPGKKTVLFVPFVYINVHHFAKTGSGQTYYRESTHKRVPFSYRRWMRSGKENAIFAPFLF